MNNSLVSLQRPTVNDVADIERLANNYTSFDLPSDFIHAAVVRRNGKVVAFGEIRPHVEAILVCDGSKIDKSLALMILMNQCIRDCKDLNYKQVHIFVEDQKFAEILKRKYGFRTTKAECLVMDIGD